jgi:GNAT superfamily N-acetyltransferase
MSPDEFIEEFHARLERGGLREPEVHVDLSTPGGPDVAFDLIKLAPSVRGRRVASRVLQLLVQLSDESGVPLQVIPRRVGHDGGPEDDALEAWYRRNGFVHAPTPDTPRLMRRARRPLTAPTSSA